MGPPRHFAHILALSTTLAACGPTPGGEPTPSSTTDVPGTTGAPGSTGTQPTSTGTAALSIGEPDTTGTTTGPAVTTTATSTSDAPPDDGTDFITRSDLGATPAQCDPHAEMPCPQGQKCSAAASPGIPWLLYTGYPSCFPILGDIQKGQPCDLGEGLVDGLDECAPGLICVDIGLAGETMGRCAAFCDPPVITGEHQACTDPLDFCYNPGCQECGLSLCIPACDPLVQDCPDGSSCILATYDAFACHSISPDAADLPAVGELCEFYSCVPGAQCAASDTLANPACAGFETCCTPYCDMDAANTCPGAAMGEVCKPYFPDPFDPELDPWSVQYERLGICGLP